MRSRKFYLLFLFAFTLQGADSWASSEGGAGWGNLDVVGRIVNLGLLVGILVYFLRKPITQFLANRSDEIKRNLAEAQRAREEANAKLAAVEARMKGLDSELRDLKSAAEKEAADERERIIKAAREEAARIITLARREMDTLTKFAQKELKAYAAELSINLAKQMIEEQITKDDEQKIISSFVQDINITGAK